ncbi:ribonuclease H-like domain-containing protein [Tanacetum coccineum]|uniref:Ribonuclease H-like domain-containing protein n=1 Tax=Tanacetum coccineum TaxID=301880 RepID=A0ABQ4WPS3_9ASTR
MLTTEEMRLKSREQDTLVDATSSSLMVLLANSGSNVRRSSSSMEKVKKPCFNFNKGSCRFGWSYKFLHNGMHGVTSRTSSMHDITSSTLSPNDMQTLQHLLSKLGCHGNTSNAPTDPAPGNWNMDTAATSHLNDSVNNLSDIFNSSIYSSVAVGDGNSIPVTNSEFDPFVFSVKDFQTHRLLLCCDSTGPLYPVTKPSPIPQVYLTSHTRGINILDIQEVNPAYDFLDDSSNIISNIIKQPPTPTSTSPTISPQPNSPITTNHTDEPSSPTPGPCSPAQPETLIFPTAKSTPHINNPLPTPVTSPIHQQTTPVFISQDPPTTTVNPNPVLVHPMFTQFRVETNCRTEHLNLHVSSISPLPKSYNVAFNDPNWQNTMSDEYNALLKNNTWTLVPRPTTANIVRCMWLFRHKFLADGTLSRYKARLVVNGSTQIEGIDVDETFSPVVKPGTIRMVLSLALSRHWLVHQLDVKNAFLHGDLTETVYMHQPPRFQDPAHPDHVCLLQRSLHGLKQTPRAWFQRFAAYITRVGFSHSRCDTSLLIYRQGTDTAYFLLYVDDIVLTASSELFRTPVDIESKLGDDGDLVADPTLYRSLAGSLQYLTFAKPDISYDVQQVCLHMHDPREPHFLALKRILREPVVYSAEIGKSEVVPRAKIY